MNGCRPPALSLSLSLSPSRPASLYQVAPVEVFGMCPLAIGFMKTLLSAPSLGIF